MEKEIVLYATDFVVIDKEGNPIKYISGDIGLWSQWSIDNGEIELLEGEYFCPQMNCQNLLKQNY